MRKLVLTNDGSHTVYDDERKAHFHSIHGAITESLHVFIENGLKRVATKEYPLSVLEIGFGTGLNAFLTYLYESKLISSGIEYTAIENDPIPLDLVDQLNYSSLIPTGMSDLSIMDLHQLPWNQKLVLNSHFTLQKIKADFQSWQCDEKFDVVYMDAFAPENQPELWTFDMFVKLSKMMRQGGLLTTYCAKGNFRRTLKSAGFITESLPGPPGKREMTIGLKL